jgi:SAM-dependent methyltransferase
MDDERERWDASYQRESLAPWDIQRPQPAVQRLVDDGLLTGDVLDAGCGTGEHAMLAAAKGAQVYGVDLSPTAIERARRKAADRGVDARFDDGDILTMPLPANAFDVVLDSGLFHSFDDDERPVYVGRLHDALRPGGHLFLLCFSDRQPGDWGPRRIRRDELVEAFADGWSIERIEPIVFEINPLPEASEVQGWLLDATRLVTVRS